MWPSSMRHGPTRSISERNFGSAARNTRAAAAASMGASFKTERVGFEPTIRLRAYRFSRPAPSTARPPLHGWGGIRTHDALAGIPVFETGSFSHSDTHPNAGRVDAAGAETRR